MNNNNIDDNNIDEYEMVGVTTTTALYGGGGASSNNGILRSSNKQQSSLLSSNIICYMMTKLIGFIYRNICIIIFILVVGNFVIVPEIRKQSSSPSSSSKNSNKNNNNDSTNNETVVFRLESSAFLYDEFIPAKYTTTISPPLQWSRGPAGTKSYILTVKDPDAPDPANPQTTWYHWIVYNIPPSRLSFEEGITIEPPSSESIVSSEIMLVAQNDWGRLRYDGPDPPIGKHRYYFTLYALNDTLPNYGPDADKDTIETALQQYIILDQSSYMGTYQKL